MKEYIVEKADTREKYEGLRDLWVKVFGDEPAFVDHVYSVFGESSLPIGKPADPDADITGYVIRNDAGKVVSSLTCYRCGKLYIPEGNIGKDLWDLNGRGVYVSYAICTDPEYRSLGLAGRLTDYVRSVVTSAGGVSILSPAEESLIGFYDRLGYEESSFIIRKAAPCAAEERTDREFDDLPDRNGVISDSGESTDIRFWGLDMEGIPGFIEEEPEDRMDSFRPLINVTRVDAETYNKYREEFLSDIAHVSLSHPMLSLVKSVSKGGDGLLVINNGDAVCAVTDDGHADELLVNPMLLAVSEEIGDEIADGISGYLGTDRLIYSIPAEREIHPDESSCETVSGPRCQAMSAGSGNVRFYYGFPIE